MVKKSVGLLWDSVSNNIGDQAIGLTLKRFCDSRKIDYEVINPFDVKPNKFSTIVIGGGELIRKSGDLFYDQFRIPGNHILNVVGTHQPTDLDYLVDYKLVSVRSKKDKQKLVELVPNLNVDVKPCTTILMQELFPEIELSIKQNYNSQPVIGVHIHAAAYQDLPGFINKLEKVNQKYQLILFPFTLYQNDEELLKSINLYLPNATIFQSVDPLEVFKEISKVDLMISTSLHAGIFAYIQGKQILSYPIYPKIENFFNDRELTDFLFSRNDDLLRRVETLFESPIEYATKIAWDKSQTFEHLTHVEKCIKNDQDSIVERRKSYSIKNREINPSEVFHQLTHSNIKLTVDLIAKNLQYEFHEKQFKEIVNQKEELILKDQIIFLANQKTIADNQVLNTRILQDNQTIKKITPEVEKLEREIWNLTSMLAQSQEEILFYANSKSWKITRPLRKIIQFMRGKKSV